MSISDLISPYINKFSENISKGIVNFASQSAKSIQSGLAQSKAGQVVSEAKQSVKDIANYVANPPKVVQPPLNTGKVESSPLTLNNKSVSTPIIDMSTSPVSGIDTSNVGSSYAAISESIKNIQAQIEQFKTEQAKTTKTTGDTGTTPSGSGEDYYAKVLAAKSSADSQIANVPKAPTLEESTNKILATFGYTPESFKEVASLNTELGDVNTKIAELDAKEQNALNAVEGRQGIDLEFMGAEQNRIKRIYAVEKSGLAAKASVIIAKINALTGVYDKAESAAKDFVTFATAERQQTINDIKYSLDFYKDVYESMDTSDRQRVNDLLDYQESQLKMEQDEYWKQMNYNLDVWKAQKTSIDSANVSYWANLLSTGQASISNVPQSIRDSVIGYMGDSGQTIISPAFAGKAKEAISAFNTAEGMLSNIEALSAPVNTAGNFVTANLGGIMKWIGGVTGASEKSRLFMQERDAFLSMLTRAAGEKGVLTTQDVERIKNALPGLNDTASVATKKLTALKELFSQIKQGTLSAYTTPLNVSGGANDPLGIR